MHQDWGAQSFAVDVAIDPDRANRAGLTNADVAVSTAVGLNGLEVTSMYRGDQIVPVSPGSGWTSAPGWATCTTCTSTAPRAGRR